MRNDLILFEFSNLDDREVLLDPAAVSALINTLERLASEILPFVIQGSRSIPAKCYIAGADRGSVRLLLRLIFNPTPEEQEKIAHLNNAADLAQKVTGIIAWVLVSIGAVAVARDMATPDLMKLPEVERATRDPAITSLAEELTRRATAVGPDQTRLICDLAPELIFRPDGVIDPLLVGDRATGPTLEGAFGGELLLTGEWIDVDPMAAPGMQPPNPHDPANRVRWYVGKIDVGGQNRLVLVMWGSKRQVPEPGARVFVKGDFHAIKDLMTTVTLLSKVPAGARHAGEILTVKSMVVEE